MVARTFRRSSRFVLLAASAALVLALSVPSMVPDSIRSPTSPLPRASTVPSFASDFSSVPLHNGSAGIAYDPATNDLFLSEPGWDTVLVLSGSTDRFVANLSVGVDPEGLAVDPAQRLVVVADNGSDAVSLIDDQTLTVVGTLGVGSHPTAVAYDGQNGTIYVANSASANISDINTSTRTVVGSIPVLGDPFALASLDDALWVAHPANDHITEINEVTNTVSLTLSVGADPYAIALERPTVASYALPPLIVAVADRGAGTVNLVGKSPYASSWSVLTDHVWSDPDAVTFDPSNGYFYVANGGSANVTLLGWGGRIATLNVPYAPAALTTDLGSGVVYIVPRTAGAISLISSTVGVPDATLALDFPPGQIAVDTLDDRYFVTDTASNRLTIVDGATWSVMAASVVRESPKLGIGLSGHPSGIAYDGADDTLLITLTSDDAVAELNASTLARTRTYDVGTSPGAVAIDASAGIAAVTDYGSDTVSLLNLSAPGHVRAVAVGSGPSAVAFLPAAGGFYVLNELSHNLSLISASSGSVVATVPLGGAPDAIAPDAVDGRLFVADPVSGNVTALNASGASVGSVRSGPGTSTLAYDALNDQVYAASAKSDRVSFFGGRSLALTGTLNLSAPSSLEIDPVSGEVLIASATTDALSFFAGNRSSVVAVYSFTGRPITTADGPSGGLLFVEEPGRVALLDAATGAYEGYVPDVDRYSGTGIASDPDTLAADPDNGLVYLSESPYVLALNGTTGAVVSNITLGSVSTPAYASGIAYDGSARSLYVCESGGWAIINTTANKVRGHGNWSAGQGCDSALVDPAAGYVFFYDGSGYQAVQISSGRMIFNGSFPTYIRSATVDPTTGDLYLADYYGKPSSKVTIFNATAGTVVGSVTVNAAPVDLVYDPAAGTIDVAEYYGQGITLINVSSQKLSGKVTLGFPPGSIDLAAGLGQEILVSPNTGYMARINASTHRVLSIAPISGGATGVVVPSSVPYTVYATPGAGPETANVANPALSTVGSIPLTTDAGAVRKYGGTGNDLLGPMPTSAAEVPMLIHLPYQAPAYLWSLWWTETGTNLVGYQNFTTTYYQTTVDKTISVGNGPTALLPVTSAGEVFVADSGSATVSVINVSTQRVVSTIAVGSDPSALAFDAATADVYVANTGSDTVSVIAVSTLKVVATVGVGVRPSSIAIDPAADAIAVVNAGSGNVTTLNQSTPSSTGSVVLGPGLSAAVYDPLDGVLLVGSAASGTIWGLRGSAPALSFTLGLRPGISGLAVDGLTGAVLVSNALDGTVSFVELGS